MKSKYVFVTQQICCRNTVNFLISNPSEYAYFSRALLYCEVVLDSFTVPIHSPNDSQMPAVKALQGGCQWRIKKWWKFPKFSPVKCAHNQFRLIQCHHMFRRTSHKRVMPAIWRPCLMPILMPTGPSWAPCWPYELCHLGRTAWKSRFGHTTKPPKSDCLRFCHELP